LVVVRRRSFVFAAFAAIAALVLVADSFPEGGGTAAAATGTFAPVADTYVRADAPGSNFGSSTRWSVDDRRNVRRNVLVRFSVTVPAGERVVSARLRAYSETSASSSQYVDAYTTSGSWTESGVTWRNAPARGTWLAKQGDFAAGSWVQWDVTAGVPTTGGQVNVKLETNAQTWIGFRSRESATSSLRPQLVIETAPLPDGGAGQTAAGTRGWGAVVAGDEFNYTGAPDPTRWRVYSAPGHAGNGVRSPAQMTVNGTRLVISGTSEGTTGGMAATFDRRTYGRWETRMALPAGDNEYHGVAILWPDSKNWPCDGEVDYAENAGDRSVMKFFHHYSCANTHTSASKQIDATRFHNYAVEWTPSGIRGYLDGALWFEDTDRTHLPPGSMHQTLQLDWFPDATPNGPAQMLVDWVRVYDVATEP
jgi:hypothetical protein